MKKIIIILIYGVFCLSSCSNSEEYNNNNSSLILGKWKLISKISNYNGFSEETATVCTLEHFKLEFKENNVLITTQVSDDPLLSLSNCQPTIYNNVYELLDNNKLSLWLVTENNTQTIVTITNLSSNSLIFRYHEDNGIDYSDWKFTKI